MTGKIVFHDILLTVTKNLHYGALCEVSSLPKKTETRKKNRKRNGKRNRRQLRVHVLQEFKPTDRTGAMEFKLSIFVFQIIAFITLRRA